MELILILCLRSSAIFNAKKQALQTIEAKTVKDKDEDEAAQDVEED